MRRLGYAFLLLGLGLVAAHAVGGAIDARTREAYVICLDELQRCEDAGRGRP